MTIQSCLYYLILYRSIAIRCSYKFCTTCTIYEWEGKHIAEHCNLKRMGKLGLTVLIVPAWATKSIIYRFWHLVHIYIVMYECWYIPGVPMSGTLDFHYFDIRKYSIFWFHQIKHCLLKRMIPRSFDLVWYSIDSTTISWNTVIYEFC